MLSTLVVLVVGLVVGVVVENKVGVVAKVKDLVAKVKGGGQ
jgi:hypothetical protein